MNYSIRDGLTFDDVLLVPQYSDVRSRSNVDVSVMIKDLKFSHPIIPANMQTVTGEKMIEVASSNGGLSILHRFMPFEEQLEIIQRLKSKYKNDCIAYGQNILDFVGVSLGVTDQYREHVYRFLSLGVNIFCIDIAHGDSVHCVEMIKWIRGINTYSPVIIAGNVATGSAAKRLWDAGADVVKVGIGPGSLCTTRIETGNGVPQLSALIDVSNACDEYLKDINYSRNLYIISDGGLKNSGDIVKALCFADMVMAGNIFAGCVETPGNVLSIMGKTYKEYKGSSTHKTNHIEGVAAIMPTKGKFDNILKKLIEGLKSGCSYQGCSNLIDLQLNPEFVKITNAGLIESHPHNILIG